MKTPFFNFGSERDETPARITPKRPMLLRAIGETSPRHAAAGEEIAVCAADLGALDPNCFEILGKVEPAIEDHRDS